MTTPFSPTSQSRPRHDRSSSVATMSGASWLPPFASAVQTLLNEPIVLGGPLAFVPVDWVETTFPNVEPVKGGKLEGYIRQLRRTVKDLSKTREVQSDSSSQHSLVLHSLEGMIEAYLGLNESVKEMIKYSEMEIKEQQKDDNISEQREIRRNNQPSNGPTGRPNPSSTAARPNIQVNTDDTNSTGGGLRVVVTPSHSSSTTSAPSSNTSAAGGGDSTPSLNNTSSSANNTTSSSTTADSPYTPKVYQETPATSPQASINTTSSSTTSTSSTSPTFDPNTTEGKKTLRLKRMAEMQQDHAGLLAVKRHCVKTCRALRNVHMLVCGVDTLKDILTDKEFQAARLAFQAITEIFYTLSSYSKLPILRSLNEHVESYKSQLRKEIFNAFREHLGNSFIGGMPQSSSSPSQPNATEKSKKLASLSKLHHCCRLIDLLYSSFERKELVKWFVAVQIQSYNQQVSRKVFGDVLNPQYVNNTLTGFDNLEKQFSWIWNELRDMWDGEYIQVFPSQWYVDALFVRKFFEILRLQITITLEQQEKRIKDENERRKALSEAKKARAIMQEMNHSGHGGGNGRLSHSNSANNLAGIKANGANGGPNNGRPGPNGDANGAGNKPRLTSSDSYSTLNNGGTVDEMDDTPVSFDFYKPLLRTIEFENQMRARWINAQTEASLTEEDLFVVLGNVPNPALDANFPAPKNPPPYPFQFAGYISSAFHPYLPHMLLRERRQFYNFLEELDAQDQWEVESAEISTCHFSAATHLFVMIQKSMERYSKVMPGDCFLDLFKEYRTSISNYLELLSKHLPTLPNNSSKVLSEEEVQTLCCTINTSDYIADRCSHLANTIIQMLTGRNPEETDEGDLSEEQQSFLGVLREQVDFTSVEEQVSHLNHRATHVLADNIIKKLEPSLHQMRHGGSSSANGSGAAANGGAVVNDENKYVREIILTLKQQLSDKAKMSSFAYLTQVIAQEFLSKYYASIKSCKFKITENVAQQMLLDLQSLKNFLLHGVPEMKVRALRSSVIGGQGKSLVPQPGMEEHTHADGSSSSSPEPTLPAAFKPFVKLVNAQALSSENLLKALTSPNQRLIHTYKIIFPKSDEKDVYMVLKLRGLNSGDQEKLIKAYNSTLKDPSQHIQIVKKDFFGNVSQMVRDAKHAIQS